MSQAIRKYQTGGKSSQEPELFEWKDVNKYNKADVISGLYRNIDTYIQHNELSGDKANQFRKAAGQFIEGIKSGTVTMNGDGTFTDTSGQMNSTGKYDKKFLGLGTKNNENNAFNRVGDYVLGYIKGMSPYKPQTAEKPKAKTAPTSFKQGLANIAMGGNWDDKVWWKLTPEERLGYVRQNIQSRHNDFINNPEAEYNQDVFGTRENWIERSSNLLKALEDNKYDPEDLKYSAAMGYGDLADYLNNQAPQQEGSTIDSYRKMWEQEAAQKGFTGEAVLAYVANREREYNGMQQQEIDKNETAIKEEANKSARDTEYERIRQLGLANIGKYNTINTLPEVIPYGFDEVYKYRRGTGWRLNFASYDANPDKFTKGAYVTDKNGNRYTNSDGRNVVVPGTTSAQRLANDLDFYIKSRNKDAEDYNDPSLKLERLSTGEYVIPDTYDANTGLIRVYNPNTRRIRYIEALTTNTGKNAFEDSFISSTTPKYKAEGGIIKAQEGTELEGLSYAEKLNRRADELARRRFKEQEEAAKQAQIEQGVASGKSPQQVAGDSKVHNPFKNGLSKADRLRLMSISGDVLSLIASMSGVGSVASAGIGAASTGLNHAADLEEGMDGWQAFKNNAGSYALDVLSLIPFAKSAKIPKMIGTLAKLAPTAIGALGAMNAVENIDSYANTWKKIGTDQRFTVEDWRNIASSIQLLTGTAAGAHRYSTAKRMVNASKSNKEQWLRTNKGNVIVDNETIDKIRNAKDIGEANNILNAKVPGASLPEIKEGVYGFRKKTGKAKIETDDYYDLSKPTTLYSFGLPYERRFNWLDRGFGNAHFDINLRLPKGVTDTYNRVAHPAAYKRAKTERAITPDKTAVEGMEAINNMVVAMNNASRYSHGVTPRRRSKITTSSYDRNRRNEAIRNERLNKQAEAREAQTARNEALTAWATNQPIPKQPLAGAARTNKQRSYERVFSTASVPNYQRVGGSPVQTPTRPTSNTPTEGKLYVGFTGTRRPVSNPPALIPKTRINPLDKFLQQSTHKNVVATVNRQIEDVAKRVAESIVRSNTRPGRPIQSVVNDLVPGKVRGHDRRARELQSTFDAPVVMEPVMPATKPIVMEPYVSRSKSKKPKARKKTSRDDKVTKKASGGVLIPKYQGGKGIRNLSSANDLSWNKDILGSSGYNSTLSMITPSNAWDYNDMQREYGTLGFGSNKPGAVELPYSDKVARYQTDFNIHTNINNGTIAGLESSGRITGRGGSFDNSAQSYLADGYAGDKTWLRHLGTNNISTEDLAKVRAGVNSDIDVVKNLDQGMLNFMPKAKAAGITSGSSQSTMPTKLESPVAAMGSNPTKKQIRDAKRSQKAAGDGTIRGAAGGGKKGLRGFSVLPEDVIALGRMVGGLATNNKAAEQYKAGLKPLLIDTYENTVPITGNYFAKASADRQASNLTSLAARPRTSDASLQLAGELEAQNKAGDIRFQGDMADADMFYKTRMMAQQESDAAKARRTDVANRNRASMLQIDAAKAQIDSAKTTANYQQVINPYLSGIENQFRQNRAAHKQYDAESYRQGLLATIQPQYDAAVKARDTAKRQQLSRQYNTDMLNYSRDNVEMPWMFQKRTPVPSTPAYSYAKGGKLSPQERIIIQRAKDFNKRMLEDNKQFHKDIMAAKKQHADMIKHMSSLTSELIKKGMSWK